MLLFLVYACLGFSTLVSARPPVVNIDDGPPEAAKRDVSFEDLEGLTRNKRDCSGREGDPPDKYFHESSVSLTGRLP